MELLPPAMAVEQTSRIVELMPEHWRREDVTPTDFEGIEEHTDLMKEITRAVPLKLLLDPNGLHAASGKEHLTASHFFLSTPVSKLGAFVSHRWKAEPTETVSAMLMHVWFTSGPRGGGIPPVITVVLFVLGFALVCIIVYPLFIIPFVLLLCPVFTMLLHSSKYDITLRILGHDAPTLWFDKATVHQTTNPLTQAGLHLFGHYLQQADKLFILFQPEYLTRVW